jgi:putative hemolysin
MWGIGLAVMAGMIALNAVLAAYEIALAFVSLSRLGMLVQGQYRGAAAAQYRKRNMEASQAAIQLGITLVGAVAAATGGAGAEEAIAPRLEADLGASPGMA